MIYFFIVGIITGFVVTWMFVSHKCGMYDFYKGEYEKYYEKWFNLHKRACEAWHMSKESYEKDNLTRKELRDTLANVFFMLDAYYGEDE